MRANLCDEEGRILFVNNSYLNKKIINRLKDVLEDKLKKKIYEELWTECMKNRLPEAEKKKMLEEATGVSEWIYAVIRKVCTE